MAEPGTRRRLSQRQIDLIFKLLDENVSYRKIAEQADCHRNTVYSRQRRRRAGDAKAFRVYAAAKFCPKCGRQVRLPCLACSLTSGGPI